MNKGKTFVFDWGTDYNFCVTKKCEGDFDTCLADQYRDQDKFFEFALLQEHPDMFTCEFGLVGYYKTRIEAEEAMFTVVSGYVFLWDRSGKCVNGMY